MAIKFLLLLVVTVGAANISDLPQQTQQQSQPENSQNRDQSQLQQPSDRQQQQQQTQTRYASDSDDQRNEELVGYDFSYSVQDPITGDYKSQEESRRNGNVRGQYSWIDANGIRQIVEYRADDRNGFNSEHRREPAARPKLSRVLKVIPAPLYTVDTVIAPVYTSASRTDHLRTRSQDSRDNRVEERDHDGHDNRDNRDERDRSDRRDERLDGLDRSHDSRRAQSEVRFQDPTVTYQYTY
ncbi:probable serine/threonine-protein kinase fhkB [Wyeomyia smithii]|uniref:probable serine/threonine-protein kinase fhkB n=1 Tax=Wyeomyia smithii TaxID=174621 RepID=UPI002467AC74|nr:probable serine/threonine-protein kinase fhkB [Wyeomyia smithii]